MLRLLSRPVSARSQYSTDPPRPRPPYGRTDSRHYDYSNSLLDIEGSDDGCPNLAEGGRLQYRRHKVGGCPNGSVELFTFGNIRSSDIGVRKSRGRNDGRHNGNWRSSR